VVTAQAFSTGVSATPDSDDSSAYPARGWLWRDRVVVERAVGAGPVDYHHGTEVRFDLGAMRRVDKGKLILTMKPTLNHGTIFNTKVTGIIRVLCAT